MDAKTFILMNSGPSPAKGGGQSGFLRVSHTTISDPAAGLPFVWSEILDDRGRPWPLIGYSLHLLAPMVARGDDIGPILDEVVSYGFNTIIEIACHLSPWKREHGFLYDPRRSDHKDILAHIFDAAAAKGLRVWHRALADCEGLSQSEQTRIFHDSCEVTHGRWNAINTVGNESQSNGWDPGAFSRPGDTGGVLYSRGSVNGDVVPYLDAWDIAEYESRRDLPKGILDASCFELTIGGWELNPHGFKVPIVDIEPAFFNDTPHDKWGDARWTDPRLARMLGGAIGATSSGGGFGASDGLECLPLQPRAAECARAFVRGLRGAFVR
jgi:hypothetical protein